MPYIPRSSTFVIFYAFTEGTHNAVSATGGIVNRITLWVFVAGGALMLLGLLTLVGGLSGTDTASSAVGWSSFIFSIGVLITSAGMLVRARQMEERIRPSKEVGQARQDLLRQNGACSVCKQEPAIIRCNLHNAKICGACLASHDTAWCEYAPCGRKSTAVGKGAWR